MHFRGWIFGVNGETDRVSVEVKEQRTAGVEDGEHREVIYSFS